MSRYLCTIKYKNKEFAIREYRDLGILYCDDKPDITFPYKIAITTDDHNINYVMLRSNQLFIANLRYYFEKGCFRFQDLKSKEALIILEETKKKIEEMMNKNEEIEIVQADLNNQIVDEILRLEESKMKRDIKLHEDEIKKIKHEKNRFSCSNNGAIQSH